MNAGIPKPKIVTIGGGTGLSTLLRGLKRHHADLTAIVTVADDGGSSGRIRREMGMLPPGDIRNCLVSLADEDAMIAKLFQYRFVEEGELGGHCVGNLMLAALCRLTGDFNQAVDEAAALLLSRGRVVPASLEMVTLEAKFKDGTSIEGQSKLAELEGPCEHVFLRPASARANEAAIRSVNDADMIVMGPGSLFTSIIPNLLFPELRVAIESSSSHKLFICNVMTQPGETTGFTAADHLDALVKHAGDQIVDTMLVNIQEPPARTLDFYRNKGAVPVKHDSDRLEQSHVGVVAESIGFAQGDYFRHDSDRLAMAVMSVLEDNIH